MLIPLLLAACGEPVRFADSISNDPLLGVGTYKGDYVLGATFQVSARRPGLRSIADWRLRSADPAVLEVVVDQRQPKELSGQAYAPGLGDTELQLITSDGELEGSAPVHVGFPDTIELHSRARALVGRPSELGEERPVQVLVGGTGTFETRFFEGERRLYGKTTLVGVAEHVEVGAPSSTAGDDTQYLTLTPASAGEHTVELFIEALPLSTLTFTALEYEDVRALRLFGTEDEDSSRDSVEDVVAELRDAEDNPVFGAVCWWSLDGRTLEGRADRVTYTYDRDAERALVAECDGFTASRVIHGVDVQVVGTSNVGCSSAPAQGGALGLLLALGTLRRRTRR